MEGGRKDHLDISSDHVSGLNSDIVESGIDGIVVDEQMDVSCAATCHSIAADLCVFLLKLNVVIQERELVSLLTLGLRQGCPLAKGLT